MIKKNKSIVVALCAVLLTPVVATAASTTPTTPSVSVTSPAPNTVVITTTTTNSNNQWTISFPPLPWNIFDRTKPPIVVTPPRQVPEIDASSGTQAVALVLGALLLSAEHLRRRRATKPL